MRRLPAAAPAVVLALSVLVAGCAPASAPHPAAGRAEGPAAGSPPAAVGTAVRTAPATPAATPRGTATVQLARLAVKGRAPKTGYDRAEFGAAWLDTDRNGCDTRNDILRRDLADVALDPRTHGCVVTEGLLRDPYTGATVTFSRGVGTEVDIDHVVALGDAWVTGAFAWEIRKRAAFANDPMNLLAVDASANRQKGDGDAATWLPGNKRFRCSYVARQIAVKAKYGLWVTPAERDALARVLTACPGRPRIPDSGAPVIAPLRLSDPTEAVRPTGHGTVAYANCDQARAAGAAPLHRGDPGYSPGLDGDHDGIACE